MKRAAPTWGHIPQSQCAIKVLTVDREQCILLRCDAVLFGTYILTFLRNASHYFHTTWYYTPEDIILCNHNILRLKNLKFHTQHFVWVK